MTSCSSACRRKSNLRYGELITDVTECIYQDKSSASLVSDILDRMSSAPRSQQTVATALRMLCMELGCSIVLGSMDGVLLELAHVAERAGGYGEEGA